MPVQTRITAIESDLEPRKIYKVTEEELNILKKGAISPIFLNFAIALLTSALSATLVYITVPELPGSGMTFVYVVMVCCYAMGALLLVLWLRSSSDHKTLIAKIEARMKEDKAGTSEETQSETLANPEIPMSTKHPTTVPS